MDCTYEARLQQEGVYTTLLCETTHYRLAAGELELMTAGGKSLLSPAKRSSPRAPSSSGTHGPTP